MSVAGSGGCSRSGEGNSQRTSAMGWVIGVTGMDRHCEILDVMHCARVQIKRGRRPPSLLLHCRHDAARSREEYRGKESATRPLAPAVVGCLGAASKYYDVELTYTSNAIEGNTLTHRETVEVIEHGITVGGKSLREHLEAVDHYDALLWMRGLTSRAEPVNEDTIGNCIGASWRAASRELPVSIAPCRAAFSVRP